MVKQYQRTILFVGIILCMGIQNEAAETGRGALRQWYDEGLSAYDNADYSTAMTKLYAGLQYARRIGDRAYAATFLGNLGMVYYTQKYPEAALGYYIHALLIMRELGDTRGEGIMLVNIGGVYTSFGQFALALETYQEALTVNQARGSQQMIASTLNGMGMVYAAQHQHKQALNQYKQALALRRELGDTQGERETMTNIGKVYAQQFWKIFSPQPQE